MNTEKNSSTEEILGSLDGIRRASAPDFFYTRLKARMEREAAIPMRKQWVLRPVFALGALLVLLAVNAAVLIKDSDSTDITATNTDIESFQSLAAEYNVTDAGSVYDLNPDK